MISEQEKDLEKINSSLKEQLREIQDRLDDKADIQNQFGEEVVLEQADISQQMDGLQNGKSSSNVALQSVDVHEKTMPELLADYKGRGYT